MDFLTLLQVLDSSLRLATPLLLACLAGLFSERAGIFDIGLEGKMLAAAFLSAAIAATTGSVWLGSWLGLVPRSCSRPFMAWPLSPYAAIKSFLVSRLTFWLQD